MTNDCDNGIALIFPKKGCYFIYYIECCCRINGGRKCDQRIMFSVLMG